MTPALQAAARKYADEKSPELSDREMIHLDGKDFRYEAAKDFDAGAAAYKELLLKMAPGRITVKEYVDADLGTGTYVGVDYVLAEPMLAKLLKRK